MDDLIKAQKNPAHQMTEKGRAIEEESFRIVDQEAGPHGFSPLEWHVVRRMIHATTDFEYKALTRFSQGAVEAGLKAIQAGARILVDARMIACGLNPERLRLFGNEVVELLAHPEVVARAKATGEPGPRRRWPTPGKRGFWTGPSWGWGTPPPSSSPWWRPSGKGRGPPWSWGCPWAS